MQNRSEADAATTTVVGTSLLTLLTTMFLVGCSPTSLAPSHRSSSTSTTSIAPTEFPHRVNPGNDGTSYEPCDTPEHVVASLGWSSVSKRDSATVDKQTARGCAWDDVKQGSVWGLSQIVGNSPSLAAYRQSNSLFNWLSDLRVDGRQVNIFLMDQSTCVTRVQSRGAGVNTIVGYVGVPAPPTSQICDRAIAFTRATISRMPV